MAWCFQVTGLTWANVDQDRNELSHTLITIVADTWCNQDKIVKSPLKQWCLVEFQTLYTVKSLI